MTPLAKRLEDTFVQLSDAPAGIVVRHPDVAPLLAEVAALESERDAAHAAMRETIDRWAGETGDGSMWGSDAYVLNPLRRALGDATKPEEESEVKYVSALARIADLESRRPVVCEYCRGTGARCNTTDGGFTPCPYCGKDGAGPGVRWSR